MDTLIQKGRRAFDHICMEKACYKFLIIIIIIIIIIFIIIIVKQDRENYRPITVLPVLGKVFYNPRHKSWNTCVIFRSPMLIWVCSHFSAPKYAGLNIGKGGRAHLSENKGVKSECKKFGKNRRQMAPVSTICEEYCSIYSTEN